MNSPSKRYDIAFIGDWLMATVPHGADIVAATKATCSKGGVDFSEPTVIEGVHLTDEPRDTDQIVYSGMQMGWLEDETGRTYQYAVKR